MSVDNGFGGIKLAVGDIFRSSLICPICEGDNLHQQAVAFYDHTPTGNRGFFITPDIEGVEHNSLHADLFNPSSRRQGMRVSFWCEHCRETPDLLVVQHKGTTYLGWEEEPSGSRVWPNKT